MIEKALRESLPPNVVEQVDNVSVDDLRTVLLSTLAFANINMEETNPELVKRNEELRQKNEELRQNLSDALKECDDIDSAYKKVLENNQLPTEVEKLKKHISKLRRERDVILNQVHEAQTQLSQIRETKLYIDIMGKKRVTGVLGIPEAMQVDIPFFAQQGIYILVSGGQVVYVGQSITTYRRIADHFHDESKDFDTVYFIPVENRKDLNGIEAYYIYNLQPTQNWNIPSHFQIKEPPEQYKIQGDVVLADNCGPSGPNLSWSKRYKGAQK